jgi:phosphatidylglycerophosphate synthase
MTPTQIQAVRVVLGLVAVGLFGRSFTLGLVSILLFIVAEALDAVDGHVARRRGLASAFGGILDISTDQVIETMYWFLFLSLGLVPLWVPVVIAVRGTLINLMRVRAFGAGQSAFDAGGMLHSAWGRALVASHISRGLMVAVKVIGFTALQLGFLVGHLGPPARLAFLLELRRPLEALGAGLVYALVAIHVIRGIVYLRDGRDLLRTFGWRGAARDTGRAARGPARPRRRARLAGNHGQGPRARGPRRPR